MELFGSLPIAQIVLSAIGLLLVAFLCCFLWPALTVGSHLRRVRSKLRGLSTPGLDEIGRVFRGDRILEPLWREYCETVHQQRELNPSTGSYETARLRSTSAAELVFRPEAVIDNRLSVEFFKHLPGVYTGLGIFGTFLGLIGGLKTFNVSDDPALVRQSLNILMSRVHDAFEVSAGAIIVAVLTTAIEKWLLARLYRALDEICFILDSFYEPGAGEEYLERLVRSSEAASKDAKILKDALVSDLELILDRVTAKQIEEASRQADLMKSGIVAGLREGLGEPIDRLSLVAEKLGGSQVDAVNTLLTDTLTHFSAQIRDLLGDQFSGAATAQQQMIDAMRATLAQVEQLGERLGSAGERASATIAQSVAASLGEIESRQRSLFDAVRDLVAEMKQGMEASSTGAAHAMTAAVEGLGGSVASLVGSLQSQVAEAALRDEARAQTATAVVKHAQRDLAATVTAAYEQLGGLRDQLASTIEAFKRTTVDSAERFASSVATLHVTSLEFARAGEGTAQTLQRAEGLSSQLTAAAAAISSTASALSAVVADYKSTRDEVMRMTAELRLVVESARKEASVSIELVSNIASASEKLGAAQREAEEYLVKISDVLGRALLDFQGNVEQSLRAGNLEFHQQLTTATSLLRQNIDELGDALGGLVLENR